MFDFAAPSLHGLCACVCGRCLRICATSQLVSLQAVPENYLCPISADVMADPVICSDGKCPATRRAR